MKKQKTKGKSGFYGESFYILAMYSCIKNMAIGRRSSKRSISSWNTLAEYIEGFPKFTEEVSDTDRN